MKEVTANGQHGVRCSGSVIDIDQKIAFPSSPDAYAEASSRVDRIKTHFSWMYLTDRHVYKLKKPLRDGGVDLTTLSARRRNAEQELHLNRRLAREVYIAVLPLRRAVGGLAIG
jgi:uncharacterized protein